MVSRGEGCQMKRILVGTDGSDTAAAAVERAAGLAGVMGAELVVLTAYERANEEDKASAIIHPLIESLQKRVEVRGLVRKGHPAEVVLDVAEEEGADLVVLGNKGMTGVRRFLLGGVPNKVSHHMGSSSLLIVKTT
jgi:nucleotide-binding universal stress UspA family protein